MVYRWRTRHRIHQASMQRVPSIHPGPRTSYSVSSLPISPSLQVSHMQSSPTPHLATQSFPKQKRSEDMPESSQPLFSISNSPSYPSSQHVLSFLEKSRITETQLTEAHVESLLNVLVLDGDVEKVGLPYINSSLASYADTGSCFALASRVRSSPLGS